METILDMFDFPLAVELIPFLALFLLPIKLLVSKSCAGVSGKTQILYALAYVTKYMDYWLLIPYIIAAQAEYWCIVIKFGFVLTVFFTIYLIYGKFKDTNSCYEDSFKIGYLISLATISAVTIDYMFDSYQPLFTQYRLMNICRLFGVFIDCVATLPQLLMIYQDKTNETRCFIFCYVYALGIYKVLHLFNYIYDYSFYFRPSEVSDLAALTHVTILFVFTFVYLRRRKILFRLNNNVVDSQILLNI